MKNVLTIISLLLVSLTSYSQGTTSDSTFHPAEVISDSTLRPTKADRRILSDVGDGVLNAKGNIGSADIYGTRIFKNLAELRRFNKPRPGIQYWMAEKGKQGWFEYVPDDVSSPDDDGITIVSTSGRRFRRVFDYVTPEMFGAKSDSITDNYLPIKRMFDAIKRQMQYVFFGYKTFNKCRIMFSPGVYTTTRGWDIDFSGLTIQGAGKRNTTINCTSNDTLNAVFRVGAFLSNPGDVFKSGVDAFTIKNITLVNHNRTGSPGNRRGSGVQDNGQGGLIINDVAIQGFKYGFNAVMGSDFTVVENSNFSSNDVGMYWGPGSQQISCKDVLVSYNQEGVVIDRLAQGTFINTTINDNINGQIVFEKFEGKTRQLNSFSNASTNIQLQLSFVDCWMESNSNNNGVIPQFWILFNGDGSDAYRNITFVRPYIVAGGTAPTGSALFYTQSGIAPRRLLVEGLVYQGGSVQYITRNMSTETIIQNMRIANGYTAPLMSDNNFPIVVDHYAKEYKSLNNTFTYYTSGADNAIQATYTNNYQYKLSAKIGGFFYNRFSVDVQNRRLFFGDPDTPDLSLNYASSSPGSGRYSKGSFTFNNSVTPVGNMGWINTGTPDVLSFIPTGFIGEYSGHGTPAGLDATALGSRYVDVDRGDTYLRKGTAGFKRLIEEIAVTNTAYNAGTISTSTQIYQDITIQGAVVGQVVAVAFSSPLQGVRAWGEVISTNTVRVYFRNDTGQSFTPVGNIIIKLF